MDKKNIQTKIKNLTNNAYQKLETDQQKIKPYHHPKLLTILDQLKKQFKNYHYTVYRVAAKFSALQKSLFTSCIPFKLVLAVFERHAIHDLNYNHMIQTFQLTDIINDVYFVSEKLGHFRENTLFRLENATPILANFFWSLFDPCRQHSISLLELKVTFFLLCNLSASDEFGNIFFNLLCDAKTQKLLAITFEHFLNILSRIFTYIGEGKSYGGHNTKLIIKQCAPKFQKTNSINKHQFNYLWSSSNIRLVIYANLISLIKRLEVLQKVIHDNACSSCKTDKIVGMRFKCEICKSISLCLHCFSVGYTDDIHTSDHRVFEAIIEDEQPKRFTHYLAKLCSVFSRSRTNDVVSKEFRDTDISSEIELVTIVKNHALNNENREKDMKRKQIGKADAVTFNENVEIIEKLSINVNNKIEELSRNVLSATQIATTQTATTQTAITQTATTQTPPIATSQNLQIIINKLLVQNLKLEKQLQRIELASRNEISQFLNSHQTFLIEIINEMRNFSQTQIAVPSNVSMTSNPTTSTPLVTTFTQCLNYYHDDNLTHSINGADLNRSYLDANKSDYSISDLSVWFRGKPQSSYRNQSAKTANEKKIPAEQDTEMMNFKILITKVKDIIEDAYSDNIELSEATQNLENVLDSIIQNEESQRMTI